MSDGDAKKVEAHIRQKTMTPMNPQHSNNGVIRVGRKGLKKFAFGEDGAPFEVDVVAAFQGWLCVDDEFRERDGCVDRVINTRDMPEYHQAAVAYVQSFAHDSRITETRHPERVDLTIAEALEFLALLRKEYDKLVTFFRPKSQDVPDSPDTSAGELQFSEEEP